MCIRDSITPYPHPTPTTHTVGSEWNGSAWQAFAAPELAVAMPPDFWGERGSPAEEARDDGAWPRWCRTCHVALESPLHIWSNWCVSCNAKFYFQHGLLDDYTAMRHCDDPWDNDPSTGPATPEGSERDRRDGIGEHSFCHDCRTRLEHAEVPGWLCGSCYARRQLDHERAKWCAHLGQGAARVRRGVRCNADLGAPGTSIWCEDCGLMCEDADNATASSDDPWLQGGKRTADGEPAFATRPWGTSPDDTHEPYPRGGHLGTTRWRVKRPLA